MFLRLRWVPALFPLLAPSVALAQRDFDASGLAPFWEIHAVLQSDREPSDEQWNRLWSTPGYALLDLKERRRASLTRALRLAYRPALAAEADTMAGKGWIGFVLPHLRRIGARRDTVTRFVEALSRSSWFPDARQRAQRYLPDGVVNRFPVPAVSLLFFIDARGYPERLLLDPLYFLELTDPVAVLGHEFHHYYRNAVARPTKPFGDDLLAWVLETTESEGVAGRVDKAEVPGLTPAELVARYPDSLRRQYFVEYQIEYRRPDYWLRRVESTLERVRAAPDSNLVLGAALHREIPDNGRIVGAFMAEAIERVLGRDRLLATVGDPFAFWRAYGDAAARDRSLPRGLSEAAMAMVTAIERRYRPD